jgi:hypothetical protein
MGIMGALAASLVLLAPRAGVANEGHGAPQHAHREPSRAAWAWFDVLYDVVRNEALAPPQASRIYGVAAVALYEAVVPGARHHRSLAGQLNGLEALPRPPRGRPLHWPTTASAALGRTVRGLVPSLKPESLAAIEALEGQLEARYRDETTSADRARSVRHGQAVGDAVLAWAAADGYGTHDACAYVPAPVEGAWEPTPPGFAVNPLQPCWGNVRPMALRSSESCALPGPPAFTGSAFLDAAVQVYETSLDLTDEQRTIAAYWADGAGATGTPAGHWMAIVGQIARQDRLSLADAAEAYARAGIAVHDAFVQCWRMKFAYNLQRPVTYIRQNIDAAWLPSLVTPPFPGYASGHSTQSGAVATVLEEMFGRKAFRDTLHEDHALTPALAPRSYASFGEAAREAAVSRLYGGIHFGFDNDDGLAAGECIGRAIERRVRFQERGGHGRR